MKLPTHHVQRRSGGTHFELVDSVRALAVVSVVAVHAGLNFAALPSDSEVRPYLERLDVVVPIFFVISGFLLYRPFARARLLGRRSPVAAYGLGRILRIIPAYWVALTFVGIWIGLGSFTDPAGLVTYYGFLQTYKSATFSGGLPQVWTLCVEVAFYVFLPLWALLMARVTRTDKAAIFRTEVAGLVALAVVSIIYKAGVLASIEDREILLIGGPAEARLNAFPAYLDQFAIGMGLAVLSVHAMANQRIASLTRAQRAWPWWLAAGTAFVLSTRVGLSDSWREGMTSSEYVVRHVLHIVVAVTLLVPTFFGERHPGLIRRALRNRALTWLGVVSYGTYLWHLAVMIQLDEWGVGDGPHAFVVLTGLSLAGAVVLGTASWFLIERPALSLKRLVPSTSTGAPADDAPILTSPRVTRTSS